MGLKSEIRISKYETTSRSEYQMIKTFTALIQYLHDFDMVWILDFGHSYLFLPALARHDMEIVLSRHDYGLHSHKLSPLKPGLGEGFRA